MQILWVVVGVITAAVIGVLFDWLIKPLLPEKPTSRHLISIGIFLIALIFIASFSTQYQTYVNTPTATHTNQSPIFTSIPTETIEVLSTEINVPTFTKIEDLVILGNDSDGYYWYAPSNGTYKIKYVSGAYSPWPSDQECSPIGEGICWKTAVYIYNNCDIKWIRESGDDLDKPGNFDYSIGITATKKTLEEAEEISQTSNDLQISLDANSCLAFITLDGVDKLNNSGWSAYTDNRGEVNINISILVSE